MNFAKRVSLLMLVMLIASCTKKVEEKTTKDLVLEQEVWTISQVLYEDSDSMRRETLFPYSGDAYGFTDSVLTKYSSEIGIASQERLKWLSGDSVLIETDSGVPLYKAVVSYATSVNIGTPDTVYSGQAIKLSMTDTTTDFHGASAWEYVLTPGP